MLASSIGVFALALTTAFGSKLFTSLDKVNVVIGLIVAAIALFATGISEIVDGNVSKGLYIIAAAIGAIGVALFVVIV